VGPLPFETDITVRALHIVNGAMKVQIHVFLTSAADGDACSSSTHDSYNFLYPLVRRQGGTSERSEFGGGESKFCISFDLWFLQFMVQSLQGMACVKCFLARRPK